MEDKCSVGEVTLTECHKTSYISKKGMENVTDLTEDNKTLLKLRIESDKELNTICLHHRTLLLKKFESLQKVCCDPIKKHKKCVRKSLRVVTIQNSKDILSKGYKVKPGQKLCSSCRNALFNNKEHIDENVSMEDDSENEGLLPQDISVLKKEETVDKLNLSFTEVGCSPLKLHSLGESSKLSYGKQKFEKFQENVKDKIEKVLDIELPKQNSQLEAEVKQKAADMDKLITVVKEKLKVSTKKKQIQILTIPASLDWTRKKIREIFEVSDYSVRQAKKLIKEKGFLAEPEPRCGKKLSLETINLIKSFYQSDDQSRVLSGMKDVVSLGKKQYERKRLILSNLNELYSNFKGEYPNVKVGFSKFCFLRPKWCILAGASGTHSVCVCKVHQNVKLIIQASRIEEDYKALIKLLLCDDANRECMFRHCSECPPKENLIRFLEAQFEGYDESDTVEYSQWVSTDRTQMIKCSSTIDDLITDLADKIEQLIPHSHIAKSQSSFLKNLKESLPTNVALVLMDFSENYSFTIQDEAQGYHWTSETCTIHPVVIHLRDAQGEKLVLSLCFISNDLKHDVSMVYEIQKIVAKFLKENFLHINEVHYFTDGCAAQYKNKYNFLNLCFHEEDFQLKAQWSFYATSHGKSECDGVGGTVKRLVRKESLQRPFEKQIITTEEFFNFCKSNISKVNCYLIPKESIDLTRYNLEKHFEDVHTLPGTRCFHNFKPFDSSGTLEARRISADDEPTLRCIKKQCAALIKENDLFPGCYVACKYDHLWYFGMVTSINKDEGDVTVKFLHPNGPSPSFSWPKQEDLCSVPLPHVLAIVDPPQTISGRTYHFDQECLMLIERKMIEIEALPHRKK